MRVDQVFGNRRFDTVVDETPVTQKVLNEALAKLLGTDLPAAMKAGFTEQNTSIAALIAKATTPPPVVPPVVVPPVVPPTVVPPIVGDPALNAKLLELERTNKTLTDGLKAVTDAREAAEKRAEQADLKNSIDGELSKYTFGKPEGKFAAAKLITPDVVRNDKGELIANNLPLADYVKNYLTVENDYLLAPTQVSGGTGAGRPGRPAGTKAMQIEDIKPGMSEAQYAQAAAEIIAALPANSTSV